jgi:hypothetical protein
MIDAAWKQARNIGFLSLARPASYVPDIVSGVAQFCHERQSAVDGILVTGDLATTGMMSDIGVAYSFITEPANRGFVTATRSPTLNFSDLPIYLVPGNHDKYGDDRASPNCKTFELKFESYLRKFGGGVGHWVREKQGRYLGFVYADFCLLSRGDASDKLYGAYGQGRVYEHILNELKHRTLNLRNRYKGICLVWVIHFAPFNCGVRLELIDWWDIIKAALALGVRATLCGHTHRAEKYVVDDHVVYCGDSAGCVDSETDSRVHVVHLDVDDTCQISRKNYVWSGSKHEFVLHNVD